jgi:hypothetical protein
MGIEVQNLEWGPVARLGELLTRHQPKTLNVTMTYATFCAIVLWTKQRMWVAGQKRKLPLVDQADDAANNLRNALNLCAIGQGNWVISTTMPPRTESLTGRPASGDLINQHFQAMPADDFVHFVRNALGHATGKTVLPIRGVSENGRGYIAGFEFIGNRQSLFLFKDDMIRIGGTLSDLFCTALSGQSDYWKLDGDLAALRKKHP